MYIHNMEKALQKLEKKANVVTPLQPHQERVVKKMQHQPGLVVAHGLGSGKTLTSIAAQDALKMPATVVVPAALKANYEKERAKHLDGNDDQPITLDSIQNVALKKKVPQNPMLIVDEAHRARDPQSSTFKTLKKNTAEKRMLLTGSPFYNHPSDIAPLVNLASGEQQLPVNKEDFESRYVSQEEVKPGFIQSLQGVTPGSKPVVNSATKGELQKVLRKWVDYHPGSEKGFPSVNRADIEVPMTEKQLELYDSLMGKAPPWVAAKIKSGLPPSKQESKDLNAFLGAARQVSNSTAPFITEGDPENPKIQKAFEELQTKLKENERMKAVIYSNYLDAGINPYQQLLQKNNIPHGVFSGEVAKKDRDALIQQYNDNKIKALLLSSAGGEGLDLKGTRLIQVLEPHWNDEKLKQVEGRGIRYQSHDHLPEEERNVLIQRYMATRPKSFWNKMGLGDPGFAVDQYLAQRSKEKEELNQQFRDLFQKVAFLWWNDKADEKKSTISNEQALQKAEDIRNIIAKRYNVTPFLTGSMRLGTNVPGQYDYDYNIHLNSKDKFLKLQKKFDALYEPSEYNKKDVDHHIFKTNILGEEVDIGLTYGQKGRDYQDSVRNAEQTLSEQRKKEIIEEKKKLQNAWFFKDRRYKHFKKNLDQELGIKRFARERIKEGFALSASDVYGHRTNHLDSIIEHGLMSAHDAHKKGLLKTYEKGNNPIDAMFRTREETNDEPEKLKTNVYLTPGLMPSDSSYGKYGVLIRKRKITPSPYLNTVPGEVITEKVKSKNMVFVVPEDELHQWKDKYKDKKFITEEEVPDNKKLSKRDFMEIPKRLLTRTIKFNHDTKEVEKNARLKADYDEDAFVKDHSWLINNDAKPRSHQELKERVEQYRKLMKVKLPIETEHSDDPHMAGVETWAGDEAKNKLMVHPQTKDHYIGHEVGHVKNKEIAPEILYRAYDRLRPIGNMALNAAPFASMFTKDPYAPARYSLATHLPTLIDEAGASYHAYKATEGQPPEEREKAKKDLIKAYRTYLDPVATPFITGAIVHGARTLSKVAAANVDPYQQQSQSSCSAACLKAVLESYNHKISELDAALEIGVKKNKGAETTQIVEAAERLGFKAYEKSFTMSEAKELTDKGIPIICDIKSFTKPGSGHYVVLTDIKDNRVFIMDPNVEGNRRELGIDEFDTRWTDRAMKYPHEIMHHWGVVITPKEKSHKPLIKKAFVARI